jgi:hypothetical protein
MEFKLQQPKKIILRPASEEQSIEISEIKIQRILDDPINKIVAVWINEISQPILLDALSGENYDNPEWTNETVKCAIEDFTNS